MAIDDMKKKAEAFTKDNADKINEALKSEQAEGISDKVLDGAAGIANKLTGGKHADKVQEVRDNLDGKIGSD